MAEKNNKLPLTDEHFTDLRKSGLTNKTIRAAGLYSVTIDREPILTAAFFKKGVQSAYAIPYDNNGKNKCKFSRYRLFYIDKQQQKKQGKYYQPLDTPCRLYIPPPQLLTKKVLTDSSTPLLITEGEKKALKGVQEKLPCVAVGGWHNYKLKNKETLISDFDKIALKGREIILVPDNDWDDPKKNIELGIRRLKLLLEDREAIVTIKLIPDGPLKGLDDYLLKNSVKKFWALPNQELGVMLDPKNPYGAAQELLTARWINEDKTQLLHHYRGDFFQWYSPAFRPVEDKAMQNIVWKFLAKACAPGSKGTFKPYLPNKYLVANAIAALEAKTHLNGNVEPPVWLDSSKGRLLCR